MLTDLTDGQPPAPPDRLGAVRRRAVLHRRRQLAAIAAVVAVLAVAAATIPLRLLRTIAPPMAPSSVPPVGAARLPATTATSLRQDVMNGKPWRVLLSH